MPSVYFKKRGRMSQIFRAKHGSAFYQWLVFLKGSFKLFEKHHSYKQVGFYKKFKTRLADELFGGAIDGKPVMIYTNAGPILDNRTCIGIIITGFPSMAPPNNGVFIFPR